MNLIRANRVRGFELHRTHDVSGVSGVGVVAVGADLGDGTVVIRWLSETPSTVIWSSDEHTSAMEKVERIHGHGGHTRIVWQAPVLEDLLADGPSDGAGGVPPSGGLPDLSRADREAIGQALTSAYHYFRMRDAANAAIHLTQTVYRPITEALASAADILAGFAHAPDSEPGSGAGAGIEGMGRGGGC
jgi:hypothetical protein